MANLKRFWLSWYATKVPFEYHGPWWISGVSFYSDDTSKDMICAAVIAETAEKAQQIIVDAHDAPVTLEWRFVTEMEETWTPYGSRFQAASWMRWPWPLHEQSHA